MNATSQPLNDRQARLEKLKMSSGVFTISQNLLQATYHLLAVTLFDRVSNGYPHSSFINDHYSVKASGCVVMAHSTLDAFVNEILVMKMLNFVGQERENIRLTLDKPLTKKIKFLKPTLSIFSDVKLLNTVRIEIAHYYPGTMDYQSGWARKLDERGLVTNKRWACFPFDTYKVAYWAVDTLNSAGIELDTELSALWSAASLKDNFQMPSFIVSPDLLKRFDSEKHEMTVVKDENRKGIRSIVFNKPSH